MNINLGILVQCDTNIDLKLYICRSVTYISWLSDFASYREDHLMGRCPKCYIGCMCCKVFYLFKMYVGQAPTFHDPVILFYILKTS